MTGEHKLHSILQKFANKSKNGLKISLKRINELVENLYNEYNSSYGEDKKMFGRELIKQVSTDYIAKEIAIFPVLNLKGSADLYNEILLEHLVLKDEFSELIKGKKESEQFYDNISSVIEKYFDIFKKELNILNELMSSLNESEEKKITEYFIFVKENAPARLHPLAPFCLE